MTTQIIEAQQNIITPEMAKVAELEGINSNVLRQRVAQGKVVIFKNKLKNVLPTALGCGLSPKICACVNNNFEGFSVIEETDKIKISKIAGAKIALDVLASSEYGEMREKITSEFDMLYGVNQLAECVCETSEALELTTSKITESIERFCEQGADFITLYPTITQEIIKLYKTEVKKPNFISKPVSIFAEYIEKESAKNPYYEAFDEILDIARTYDVVLSLASVFSFNSLSEFPTRTSYAELLILSELVQRAREAGVQIMVEAGGFMQLAEIEKHIELIKKLTFNSPLALSGPKVAEDMPEIEFVNSAIGAAVATNAGCDMLFAHAFEDNSKKLNARQLRENVLSLKLACETCIPRADL
ncbi:phosphomethylpyrimidine synthase ThiC [bacterium]|nr:phosphomethylpyrimidine synthase ThiC [bacterium]